MFRNPALSTIALTLLALAGHAQQPCSRTIAESQPLAGFKLGTSIDDARSILGRKHKMQKMKTGEGSYFENFTGSHATGSLTGAHALFLRFFNFRLYQIEVFYEDTAKPGKLNEFTQTLSSELNLPSDAWQVKNNRAEIDCGDLLVTADTILNPHVELTDDAAYKHFQEKRRESKKEAK